MSLSDEQWEFLRDVAKLISYAEKLGFKVTGGELWRPEATQKYYVDTGLSKTMKSMHLKRCAIDLMFFVKDENDKWQLTYDREILKPVGDYWESLDPKNEWGGNWIRFLDVPHFQRTV